MQALAIFIILGIFLWICSWAPLLGLVLFCIFGMPMVIMAAFAVDSTFGLVVLFISLGIGVYFLPWFFIPAILLGVIILAGAGA